MVDIRTKSELGGWGMEESDGCGEDQEKKENERAVT